MNLIEDLKILVNRLQTETDTLVALLVAVLALTVLYYFVFSFLLLKNLDSVPLNKRTMFAL